MRRFDNQSADIGYAREFSAASMRDRRAGAHAEQPVRASKDDGARAKCLRRRVAGALGGVHIHTDVHRLAMPTMTELAMGDLRTRGPHRRRLDVLGGERHDDQGRGRRDRT